MNFDNSFIEKIKNENDIVDIVSEYVSLKGTHGNWMGLCPFHNEKTPSFSVNQNGQFYKCFGCQKSGDVILSIRGVAKELGVSEMSIYRIVGDLEGLRAMIAH